MADLTAQDALVMMMVMVSASDRAMNDQELAKIGEVVSSFPVFEGYSRDRLVTTAETAGLALSEEGGLDSVLEAIKDAVPYDNRLAVIEALWKIVLADGTRAKEEDALLRLVANLLGITDKDSALARQRVAKD